MNDALARTLAEAVAVRGGLTEQTPRMGATLHHGCWAGQAEVIARLGLWTTNGYAHFATSPGPA